VFWAVAGRTQAAEGKLATSFFAAEIGLDPISAFAKNSGALDLLHVPIHGSLWLFTACMVIFLFTTTSLGILLGTVGRTMPQFGLLMLIILLPLEMLSGGVTPRESMPDAVQNIMLLAPTTHFVSLAQAVLYRGADFEIVWRQMAVLFVIGCVFFLWALTRFRRTIGAMA